MPTNLRFTTWEQDELRKKAVEINKLLVKMGKQPLRASGRAGRHIGNFCLGTLLLFAAFVSGVLVNKLSVLFGGLSPR